MVQSLVAPEGEFNADQLVNSIFAFFKYWKREKIIKSIEFVVVYCSGKK